ncbi:MAG: DNA polymerase III [Candidatus Levybacteria bacterium]|nr:DNA polymerase III [Candidatus Levybacteria bacterium]
MTNKEIAKLFRNIAAAYRIKNEKKFYFQMIAYENAADTIDALPEQLKNLYKEGRLENVPNIGKTIKGRIEELFKKGKVSHFQHVLEGIPPAVFEIMEIPSMGPKKAFKLSLEFNIIKPETAIDMLEKIAKSGEISKVPGFGEKSEKDIIRAIEEFKLGKGKTTRMVVPIAYEAGQKILEYLYYSKYVKQAELLGSLRRMMPTVGDIDIAVSTDKPKEVINHFIKMPSIERVIEKGPSTVSVLALGGKQVDLMSQPPKSFGSLLQHFTGSKNHNVHLREIALKKGMSLSERGIKLKENGKVILKTYDTEEKFYKALGMDWIPPEIREDLGEIEKAQKHDLPNLIELSDIRGDFHIHSSFPIEPSHDLGRNSIDEILNKAKSLNYEYLAFSEHNPSISKHTSRQIYDLVAKRNDEIDKVSQLYKIKIIKMMEVDILPSGKLAVDDKVLNILDGVIVSIHSVFGMDIGQMTERVLKGLSHEKARILAHPTGRLLNKRNGYELNWDKLFDFCKKNKKIIEINSWPYRLDLPDPLIREAKKYGIKFSIDTDSHVAEQMELMRYGVALARRGWAEKDDILNTFDYNRMIKILKGGE